MQRIDKEEGANVVARVTSAVRKNKGKSLALLAIVGMIILYAVTR